MVLETAIAAATITIAGIAMVNIFFADDPDCCPGSRFDRSILNDDKSAFFASTFSSLGF